MSHSEWGKLKILHQMAFTAQIDGMLFSKQTNQNGISKLQNIRPFLKIWNALKPIIATDWFWLDEYAYGIAFNRTDFDEYEYKNLNNK